MASFVHTAAPRAFTASCTPSSQTSNWPCRPERAEDLPRQIAQVLDARSLLTRTRRPVG